MRLILSGNSRVLVENLRVANTPLARIRGLLFTKSLSPGDGLWLVPCNAIHSIGMNYPIDVIYLDKKNKIVKLTRQFCPNRIGPFVRKARSVIELPARSLERIGVNVGDTLQFR